MIEVINASHLCLSIHLTEVSPQIYFGAHQPQIDEGIFLGITSKNHSTGFKENA
jgi:hypothetical protein